MDMSAQKVLCGHVRLLSRHRADMSAQWVLCGHVCSVGTVGTCLLSGYCVDMSAQ